MIFAGNWLVKSLSDISETLGIKQFTVAFLLMSLATSSPELFIGVNSALRGISELSLGNIIGQNIIHFTVAIFICVIISGGFYVKSKAIINTAFFSGFMALFPLILIMDGDLSRIDGLILIGLFCIYIFRMLKNSKTHDKKYDDLDIKNDRTILEKFRLFFKDFGIFILGSALLLIASYGIVTSSMFFAEALDIPLVLIGVLIVGLGTALPEVYFSAFSAKSGAVELMAGNLLGSTVVSTSLVLGIVSIISPINNIEFLSYFLSRVILFISVILFIFFMLSDKKITTREGWLLLMIYVIFVATEILI